MRTIFALAVSAAILGAASVAAARVTGIQILSQEPFADGAAFGPAGSYVRVTAIVRGELDPEAPANAGIADLDRAPRNARGMVEYDTDVFLLRPADPAKGSGTMLYEVTNRGNKLLMPWINDAAERPTGSLNDPRTLADAGNTFTFRRGYTMVWSGWQPDAPTTNAGMTIRAPVATDQGRPIVQRIRDEIVAGTRGPERVEIARLPYPAASTDKTRARLTAHARQVDPRTEIPPDDWAFVDSHSVRLLPQGTLFKPRQIYELWYEATDPTVTGIGFAATRDLVSFLRYERTDAQGNANPLLAGGNGIRHTIGFGISLSGRFIRNYLELGMNADEAGRRVFDGVLPHISGAGKVFGNTAFAMPGRTATQHEDRFYPENWFPYGYATLPDPVSGKPGSLLRGDGSDPLIVETNTSTEYWQKGASLVHTDPATGADIALPPNVRMFLIAGTEHAGHAGTPSAPGFCANARNPHSAGLALRALLADLDQWVADGTPPPASRVPRASDGTGVAAASVRFPAVPGVLWPPGDNPVGPPVDWIDPPATLGRTYRTLVSALDADGNEVAGLHLPDIAAPAATFTGTNVYRDYPSELCDRDGTCVPLARTQAEREGKGDPRRSLEERYGARDRYAAAVKSAADSLVAARLLLPEDAARYINAAAGSELVP
jgi:hypothetical protein